VAIVLAVSATYLALRRRRPRNQTSLKKKPEKTRIKKDHHPKRSRKTENSGKPNPTNKEIRNEGFASFDLQDMANQ
jgi:hypothetical protein